MKKPYSEPNILFESFALSTSIAAGCEEKPHNNTDNCGVSYWGQSIIFTQAVSGCTSKVDDGSASYGGLCYHTPFPNYNVFYS